jgi:predicted ester cyclase
MDGHKQFIIAIINAFPDVHHEIIDMVAEGEDKVADRFNITGTHEGEIQGIPPLAKKYLLVECNLLLSLMARL